MKGHYNDNILITGGFFKDRTGVITDYDFLLGYHVSVDGIFKTAYLRFWQFKKYYSDLQEESFKCGYEKGFNEAIKIKLSGAKK